MTTMVWTLSIGQPREKQCTKHRPRSHYPWTKSPRPPKAKMDRQRESEHVGWDDLRGLSRVVEKDQTYGPRATRYLSMPEDVDCTGRPNADLGDLGLRVLNPQMRDGKPQLEALKLEADLPKIIFSMCKSRMPRLLETANATMLVNI